MIICSVSNIHGLAQSGSYGAKAGTYVRSGFYPKDEQAYGSCTGARATALTQENSRNFFE